MRRNIAEWIIFLSLLVVFFVAIFNNTSLGAWVLKHKENLWDFLKSAGILALLLPIVLFLINLSYRELKL